MKPQKKKFWLPALAGLALLVGLPGTASAHEVHVYKIGNQSYQLTIGSLNEPLIIDDKSGVDFRISKAPVSATAGHGDTSGAIEGVDKTLKVEIIAGDKKKTFDLSPVFGTPGSYKTTFYPTVQTTLAYRFFGTVGDTPIDLTFTCNPAGHPQADEDTTAVNVSEGVTRLSKRGAFGCPQAKAEFGFPEPSVSAYDNQTKIQGLETAVAEAKSEAGSSRSLGLGGIVAGLLGLVVAGGVLMRSRAN